MIVKAFARREATVRAPSRMHTLDDDPAHGIVCVAHTVCFVAFVVLAAEICKLWLNLV